MSNNPGPRAPHPYYQDDDVTLYHGDALDILPTLGDRSVTCVITDPPYTERTHTNARKRVLGNTIRDGIPEFAAFTTEQLVYTLTELGRITDGWVIATLDYRHAFQLETNPPEGLTLKRVGVWVKTNATPQLSGDRPAHGWEAIVYLHRTDVRSRWNGGGRHGNYYLPTNSTNEGHPAAKPLPLIADLVRKFTNPVDTILDPYAGSGTTLRAAKDEGRHAIGIELDERYCEIAARRLSQDALFGQVAT